MEYPTTIERIARGHIRRELYHMRAIYKRDSDWRYYGSRPSHYEGHFQDVLDGKTIPELIAGKPDPVVIDLMAPSGTIATLFEQIPDSNKLGIAVSLGDLRTNEEKERDSVLGIEQIKGDITDPTTWDAISEILAERRVDLIMERAFGGIDQLPAHPAFYGFALRRMWKMLAVDGVILIQTPPKYTLKKARVSISRWVEVLNEHNIEARYDQNALYMRKSSASPSTLPFPRDVLQPEMVSTLSQNQNYQPILHPYEKLKRLLTIYSEINYNREPICNRISSKILKENIKVSNPSV